MFERQQDVVAYVRSFVRQDLFITVTTNPKWTEIMDRPDLLVSFSSKNSKAFEIFEKKGALLVFGGLAVQY